MGVVKVGVLKDEVRFWRYDVMFVVVLALSGEEGCRRGGTFDGL